MSSPFCLSTLSPENLCHQFANAIVFLACWPDPEFVKTGHADDAAYRASVDTYNGDRTNMDKAYSYMNNRLAEVLAEKNILTRGMEVEARYNGKALGGVNTVIAVGTFLIESVKKAADGRIVFFVSSTRAGERKVILADSVLNIEGQDPDRFAASYDLQPDGSDKPKGKRRGRIPKHLKAQMAAEAAGDDLDDDEDEDEDDVEAVDDDSDEYGEDEEDVFADAA